MITRRAALAALPALGWAAPALALPPRTLEFPRDHGAHPELRTEWWYITGHAQDAAGREFGFQVTFFRSRVDATQDMQSAFAAKQLVFAHAAVTDLAGRKLWHDQRIARAGFGIAEAATDDARLRLRDWSLVRSEAGWQARVPAGDFALDLRCAPTQPPLRYAVSIFSTTPSRSFARPAGSGSGSVSSRRNHTTAGVSGTPSAANPPCSETVFHPASSHAAADQPAASPRSNSANQCITKLP